MKLSLPLAPDRIETNIVEVVALLEYTEFLLPVQLALQPAPRLFVVKIQTKYTEWTQ